MPLELLTLRDLQQFKKEFFEELQKVLLKEVPSTVSLLKSPEVCRMLRISPGTLQNLRRNETLRYIRVGGILYYEMKEIEELISKRRFRA